jgi:hypothetical protein
MIESLVGIASTFGWQPDLPQSGGGGRTLNACGALERSSFCVPKVQKDDGNRTTPKSARHSFDEYPRSGVIVMSDVRRCACRWPIRTHREHQAAVRVCTHISLRRL